MATVRMLADEQALAEAAAGRLAELVAAALAARGAATVCLTGGRTPERMYRLLARSPWRERIDWSRIHLFWGDERHVPPDHPDSNYGMAERALIAHVPVPSGQVHRMHAELPDAAEAARAYEPALPGIFDVMLLGLGEDAHVASIFPGSPLLAEHPEHARRVAAVWAPHLSAWRITLTPPTLLASRAIVMLVAGEKKADAVRAALDAPLDSARYPAQLLRQAGDRTEWLLDAAAAARLRDVPRG